MGLRISMEKLILAWRKAKVDLYYSTNPPLFEMADYEANLIGNLQSLQDRVTGKDEQWVNRDDFLGTWTLAPKSIQFAKDDKSEVNQPVDTPLIFADPADEWYSEIAQHGSPPTAEFRLMARCSIAFHVFSALWMQEVGHLFEEKLSDNVYGSRLRRNGEGAINRMSLGSFKPYLMPFRHWRDGAIKAMRAALDEKKKVISLTADVSSFYHELNSGFMLDKRFLKLAEVELSESQEKLHRLFISALQAWAKNTPLKKGLPVGLPASALVANAALIELDRFIERQVVPLYYGRYVDDILLVMENTSDLATSQGFWDWIISRGRGKELLENDNGSLLFKPPYLKDSRIAFKNSKNKLFLLSGGSGKALVNAISEQINQRASEWRSLPILPENPGTIATDLLKATNHSGEQADNLRKTDSLTLHRAGFALNLRDYEAYERDLPPDAWQSHRHAFFEAVIDHLLTPKTFFEQAQYLPRIVRMATACADFEQLGAILRQVRKLTETVTDQCVHVIKASDCTAKDAKSDLGRWQHALDTTLTENILSALPSSLNGEAKSSWKRFVASHWLRMSENLWIANGLKSMFPESLADLQRFQTRLFSHDLAHIPLRFSGLPREVVSQRGIPARRKLIPAGWEADDAPAIGDAITTLARWFKPKLRKGIPPGLFFATRPFNLNELYLIAPAPFNTTSLDDLSKVISALRGFNLSDHKMPRWDKHQRTLEIPDGEPKAKHTIAVSSWETRDSSFSAAVMRHPDPESRRRYQRLIHLINELISRPDGAGYLILPELAMPPQWFMRIAGKLNGRRISLLAGVEYLHAPSKRVHNQIWASLTHDGLGFPSLMLYRQDKQSPAFHEEQELFRLAGVALKPANAWPAPPVIEHGDFHFALLNCSELTNIRYRSELRGKIDALFVPEWNSDTDTFNALVESAALDIHAYIIQCNNRQYGDSRIRAPYKERWKRDLLRVKGGNHDYCITGEIDVLALRQFQSSLRSPTAGFKPVPDGFNRDMAYGRKVLPEGQ